MVMPITRLSPFGSTRDYLQESEEQKRALLGPAPTVIPSRLSALEAKDYGIDLSGLGDNWAEWAIEGLDTDAPIFVAPDQTRITSDEEFRLYQMRDWTPQQLASQGYGRLPSGELVYDPESQYAASIYRSSPEYAIQQAQQQALTLLKQDTSRLAEELAKGGKWEFSTLMNLSESDLRSLYAQETGITELFPEQDIDEALGRLFPANKTLAMYEPVEAVLKIREWAESSPEAVLDFFKQKGDTPDTRLILQHVFPGITEQDIAGITAMEDTPSGWERMWRKLGESLHLGMKYNLQYSGIPEKQAEQTANALVRGGGNFFSIMGFGADWLKGSTPPVAAGGFFDQVAGMVAGTMYDALSLVSTPAKEAGAGIAYATRPSEGVFFKALESLPTTMAAMAPGIALVATGVGAPAGVTWAGTVLTMMLGAAASRPLEGFMEAGGTYQEALGRGMSEAEASKAATEVFKRNMLFMGADAAQYAIAFGQTLMPKPLRAVTSLVGKGLVTTGKVGVVALTEAGEEYYQELIQRAALGEDVEWSPTAIWGNLSDDELRDVVIIGAMMGGVLGGTGDVITTLKSAMPQNLPKAEQQAYYEAKAKAVREGVTLQEAEMMALDAAMQTEGGRATVQKVLKALRVEEFRRMMRAKSEAQGRALDERLDAQRPDVRGIDRLKVKIGSLVREFNADQRGAIGEGEARFWEMTQEEFVASEQKKGVNIEELKAAHRQIVYQALADGEFVSQNVTKDYPGIEDQVEYDTNTATLAPAQQQPPAVTPEQAQKQPWEMTKEEYRRTWVSDEFMAQRPELEERAQEEEANIEERQGFEYSSGVKRQILGAPNLGRMGLDRLDARMRLAPKRHERLVRQALASGKPVPAEVLAEYPDLQQPVAEPVEATREPWQMTEEEFKNAAKGGVIDPTGGEQAAIAATARGEKPLVLAGDKQAMIDAGLQVMALPKDSDYKGFLGFREGNENLAREFIEKANIPEPLGSVEIGRLLGYSDQDIAFYVNKNFSHKELVEQAIQQGRAVPAETLYDYPDLQRAQPAPEAQAGEQMSWTENVPPGYEEIVPKARGRKYAEYRGHVIEDTGFSGQIRFHLHGKDRYGTFGVLTTSGNLSDATARIDRWIVGDAGVVEAQAEPMEPYRKQIQPPPLQEGESRLQPPAPEAPAVKRPTAIGGKTVITEKTEAKIDTLKQHLIRTGALTEEHFQRLLKHMELPTSRFESEKSYITELDARTLLVAMNQEAIVARSEIAEQQALAAKPQISGAHDSLSGRVYDTTTVEGQPVDDGAWTKAMGFVSARYYYMQLAKALKNPRMYSLYRLMTSQHRRVLHMYQQHVDGVAEKVGSEIFKRISQDKQALGRIENYIAAENKMSGIEKPALSPDETKFADALMSDMKDWQNTARMNRFLTNYNQYRGDIGQMGQRIPNAPLESLQEAVDIYETQGKDALREYLDSQTWGIIKDGYNPLGFVKPTLWLKGMKGTTFGKGHIRTREGIQHSVTGDTSLVDRWLGYMRQMYALSEVEPVVGVLKREFEATADVLPETGRFTAKKVGADIERNINEFKGYRESDGDLAGFMRRLYTQTAAATFMLPDKAFRNLFQNLAFNPDRLSFIDPRNKRLTPEQRLHYDVFVSQLQGLKQDFLLRGTTALPGFDTLSRLANKVSVFPLSDQINRMGAYWVRANKAQRALDAWHKHNDMARLMKESGAIDLDPMQQQEALKILAQDKVDMGVSGLDNLTGEQAFVMYNAEQLAANVHFLYERSQRSMSEQGSVGEMIGNIFLFQRAWGERLALQGAKLKPDSGASFAEKRYAAGAIIGMVAVGLMADWLLHKSVGKAYKAYNPLNLLVWGPGGLMFGVAEQISTTAYDMISAIQGDKAALGRIPWDLKRSATLAVPFYEVIIRAADALTDMKDVDVYAMRKIRSMVDGEYQVRGGDYEVDRSLIEALQRALFGGAKDPEVPLVDLVNDAIARLGTLDPHDPNVPWEVATARMFGMGDLSQRFNSIFKDDPGAARGADMPLIAGAWADYREAKAEWESLPNQALYKINMDPEKGLTLEDYYQRWQATQDPDSTLGNITKRQYELLQQYNGLSEDEQADFLEAYPEIANNPRQEWLKNNPDKQALMVLWGAHGKVSNKKAYDALQKMITELDIPDSVLPDMPPRTVAEPYFNYLDAVEQFKANSAEARLIRLESTALDEWGQKTYGWQPVKGNVDALRISVEYREQDDTYDGLGTSNERLAYLIENPEYTKARYRREAYNKGYPAESIDDYVAYREWTSLNGYDGRMWLSSHRDFYNVARPIEGWAYMDFRTGARSSIGGISSTFIGARQ